MIGPKRFKQAGCTRDDPKPYELARVHLPKFTQFCTNYFQCKIVRRRFTLTPAPVTLITVSPMLVIMGISQQATVGEVCVQNRSNHRTKWVHTRIAAATVWATTGHGEERVEGSRTAPEANEVGQK